MPRYVAFLRGVTPLNARMPALRQAFEDAGFSNVRTVLGSGNVVFDARAASEASLERRAEAAMQASLARVFYPIVRSTEHLASLLAADPFGRHRLPPGSKCIVSFLREARAPRQPLPMQRDGATILAGDGREVFTAYLPTGKGPVFMQLIESAYGSDITTRTLETVRKCAAA